MKLENQVCSLELSKKLKELVVRQESLFYWRLQYTTSEDFIGGVSAGKVGHFGDYRLEYLPKPRYRTADVKWNESDLAKIDNTEISAFTVAELGEMLPGTAHPILNGYWLTKFSSSKYGNMDGNKVEYSVSYELIEENGKPSKYIHYFENTEADARAKMLVYLLENKLITI